MRMKYGLERFAVENGNRSGGCGSGRPRRMSLKATLFRRNDGSAVFETGQFQKQNALRAVWAALIALTLCLAVARPASAAEPEAYEKAKVELSRLRGDEKRAQYRHSWLKIADDFMDVYESHSDWINRPAALFRSAEALEEMARRSFVRKDAQNAAARFESVARKHPSSVLADDALYRAAVVRKELMRDDEGARSLLGTIGKKYAKSDYAPKAREYLAGLDGSAVASLGPAPVVKSVAEGARVAQITPQIKDKDVVRIVISVDKPVSWRIQHQAADSKSDRPARLTLDLTDATPGDKLKSGARYTKMGIFSRYAVDYTASQGKTRILLDFDKLQRYTVRAEKSPFRIIIEATGAPKALAQGIQVGRPDKAPASSGTAAVKPATSSNVAAQLGLSVRTVVIDPGHGGKDPGTMHNSIVEREVSLDIARRVGNVLRAAGYNVVFTRDRDTWVSLSDRSRLAVKHKGDLFVSIHVNASPKPEVSGVETYYLDLAGTKDSVRLAAVENAGSNRGLGEMEEILADMLLDSRMQESRRLASSVQTQTLAQLKKRGQPAKSGGTKGAPFHVLIGSSMPGVLVEVGYCTNAAEAKRLRQSAYRDALAEGIANGVHHYARQLETAAK